jgi:hypothetical protein
MGTGVKSRSGSRGENTGERILESRVTEWRAEGR